MFSACQFTPEISSMIGARHQIAADHRPSVSRAGPKDAWTEAWLGLVLDRWQPIRHGSNRPGGNMVSTPNAQAWRQIVGPVP